MDARVAQTTETLSFLAKNIMLQTVRKCTLLTLVWVTAGSCHSEQEEALSQRALTASSSPEEHSNTIGMRFKLIPVGEFVMGSPAGEGFHDIVEQPQHRVRITTPFYMGVTEVTQGQYAKVMGENPSLFKGGTRPVDNVSWLDAMAFCQKLSVMEKMEYRLPSEAEWEYACRAGTTTRWCSGDDEAGLKGYAWYETHSASHSVAQKKPNRWDLYDMHGNVWEWCEDWFSPHYYANSVVRNPKGPATGKYRVIRGGSWRKSAWQCQSAYRSSRPPDVRFSHVGFRVVLVAGE